MSLGDNKIADEASFFKMAFNFAPMGTAVISMGGAVLRANAAVSSMLGYTGQELSRMNLQLITHRDDWEKILQSQKLLSSRESPKPMDIRFIHKNGNIVESVLLLAGILDDTDRPAHVIAQLLAKTEPMLDRFYDFVSIHSAEGAYLDMSPSFHEVLGYSKAEMLGKPLDWFLHPEDLVKGVNGVKGFEALLQHDKNHPNLNILRFRKKDGQYLLLQSAGTPVLEPSTNRLREIVVVSRDVTTCAERAAHLEKDRYSYQIISENALDIITFTDPCGVIEYVSPAVGQLLGYRPEEMRGTQIMNLCHPDDLAELPHEGFLPKIDVEVLMNRIRHKEGHYVWLETAAKSVRNESGDIVRILCVSRDMTKRKAAEDELRATKDRLQSFLENNADAIWMVNREGKIQEANAAFERMFHWKASEIISKELPTVPPGLRDQMKLLYEQVLQGHSFNNMETIRQRKDGSLIEVCTTLSPVRDSDGHIVGISGTCRDISEKQRAERKLKATVAQLEAFINQNVDPVLILNTSHEVIRVNQACEKIFGWASPRLSGTSVHFLPNLTEACRLELGPALTGMAPCSFETTCLHESGGEIPVHISTFPLLNESGDYSGWAVILRDMTAYRRAEQLLIDSEKTAIAGQLAAGIAHEIRNPITTIKGFIHLMNTGMAEKKHFFEIISSEIERIEMILSELLILAKPQLVRFDCRDIRVLLGKVVTLLDTQAIINNVQITTRYDAPNPYILCDENQLKQVCINFIKNAIESMPDGGTVQIQLTNPDEHTLVLRFIDEGCGIPEHIISKLGEPFYTTKEKGTGLGFMVSKKIIENHKGVINVSSRERQGTTIEVMLPVAKPV